MYVEKLFLPFRFKQEETRDLVKWYLTENPGPNYENIVGYNNKNVGPNIVG